MGKVAVVGAGASGLAAIKCCLDEGLDVVCFERTDSIGGLWHYTQEAREGQACVMKSTVINTSKEMMCYSDFPIPKEYPVYMHHSSLLQYFKDYADTFTLGRYIRFQSEVVHITPSVDSATTGSWLVQWRDGSRGTVHEDTFSGVMLCTGHHATVNMPRFDGIETFTGRVLHSQAYKHPDGFTDKRVVVVGLGNSAVDIAVELSRVTKQLFLSTRRGGWIVSKLGLHSLPGDLQLTRANMKLAALFPGLVERLVKFVVNCRLDHGRFGLQPSHSPFQQHPTVSEDLAARILTGSVTVKANIRRFTETGVQFEDGTLEENIDTVIMATGYVFDFPFLDPGVLDVMENKADLYKHMFPPDLPRPSLALIGCVQVLGALVPVAEMQCRLAARAFKGLAKLPSREEMWADIRRKRVAMESRYLATKRHTMQVDFIPFMDELAEIIGCKPNLCRLVWSDPRLAWQCCFGPCTPSQFRLLGPGSWCGAREAVMTTWERVYYPLCTRQPHREPTASNVQAAVALFILLVVLFLVVIYTRV